MMNIILFPGGGKKPVRISLSRRRLAALAAAVALPVLVALTAGLALGSRFSVRDAQAIAQVAEMRQLVAAQGRTLMALEERQDNDVNALALRLGDLQARSMRVEALGARLAQQGQLEGGEFDFTQPPPIGGPHDPEDLASMSRLDLEQELRRYEQRLVQQTDQLSVLESLLTGRELDENLRPAGRPVQEGWLSSRYGKRVDPFSGEMAHHPGIDFSGPANAPILAVADGVVVWSGRRPDYGLTVEVDHGNGYLTRYAHNSKNLVTTGQRVSAGDTLGLMGQTGRATGPHVHFEVFLNGRRINPSDVVAAMR